jgi:two-component system response regulator PrrA
VVRIGNLEIRLFDRRVLAGGVDVPLTPREFEILELLLHRQGHAVSRAHILEAVWGKETEGAEASLEVIIGRLRRKLSRQGLDGPIRTHRGFGYSIDFPS